MLEDDIKNKIFKLSSLNIITEESFTKFNNHRTDLKILQHPVEGNLVMSESEIKKIKTQYLNFK